MITSQAWRHGVRKVRAHWPLNVGRNGKGNKKGFFKYLNSKRKARENRTTAEQGVLVT